MITMNKKPKAIRLKAFWSLVLVHCMSGKNILFYDKKGTPCMFLGKVEIIHVLLNDLHTLWSAIYVDVVALYPQHDLCITGC